MNPIPIPAFSDNYLWLLPHRQQAVVVDPGDAKPIMQYLQQQDMKLDAILVTHHHADHIGGVAALKKHFDCPVFAPDDPRIGIKDIIVGNGDRIQPASWLPAFQVLAVPGHTLSHVAYAGGNMLFCGDTLFSIGCGRLFEGTPEQMWHSLQRLAALPGSTAVYCAHEYTLSNLRFALAVLPDNPDLLDWQQQVRQRLQAGKPSLPSSIAVERALNPFLNCQRADIQAAAEAHCGMPLPDAVAVFACLRRWKDNF